MLKISTRNLKRKIFSLNSRKLLQYSTTLSRKYCISSKLCVRAIIFTSLSVINDIRRDSRSCKIVKRKKDHLIRELQRELSHSWYKTRYNFPIVSFLAAFVRGSATIIIKDDRLSVRSIVVKAKEDRSYAT